MKIDFDIMARDAIRPILAGQSPNGVKPSDLGPWADLYVEIARAHDSGGTAAARRAFDAYAALHPAAAALIAGDPKPAKQVWSVADLLATDFPEPKWAIPGLLPAGLTVFAGRPKLGKSWLALAIATAVGCGGLVLGRRAQQGKVLYLALEDNPRRLKDRLGKQRAIAAAAIDFHFEWPALVEKRGGQPGTLALIEAINAKGYSLVVIDTISRALGHADQLDQADMNVAFGALQRMAIERDICLLLIDHHRKSASSVGDVIDDVMGATSKVGVADAAIGIYRERGQSNATLKVSGRDVDDQELAIRFDRDLFCWQLIGTEAGVKTESLQAEILAVIKELGGVATATRVAKGLDGQKDPSNIRKEMLELVNKGVLKRVEKEGREVKYQIVKESYASDPDDGDDG